MTDSVSLPPKLKPITTRPPLGDYLRDLKARHEYIRAVPRNDIRAQNLDTVLGNLWLLGNPLLSTGVYFLVFGVLLETDRGLDNFLVYLVIGIMIFRFFSAGLTGGANCVQRSETLMRSLYFPRAVVPLANTLGNFYVLIPGMAVVLILTLATGEMPTWRWLVLPIVLAITFTFVAGVTFWSARAGHNTRDLASLLPHLTRLGFYASGTLYDPEAFTTNKAALLVFDVNPVYQLLSLTRWCLIGLSIPSWFWITAPLYAVTALVGGFYYFYRGELTYGAAR